jgi:hypothetical protein
VEVLVQEQAEVELVQEARALLRVRVVQVGAPQGLVLELEGRVVRQAQLGRQVQRELLARLALEAQERVPVLVVEQEQVGQEQAPVDLQQVREELVRALAVVVVLEVAVAVILVLAAEVLYRLQ